jgi:hypothetical protein
VHAESDPVADSLPITVGQPVRVPSDHPDADTHSLAVTQPVTKPVAQPATAITQPESHIDDCRERE